LKQIAFEARIVSDPGFLFFSQNDILESGFCRHRFSFAACDATAFGTDFPITEPIWSGEGN